MKSLFKKYFFILAIMCIAVTCIATFGYADFVFNTADISNGIGSSNNSITQTADPIRQNAVFGEAGDASASGTQYYDVYFMAQSVEDGVTADANGNLNHYYYMDIPDNYSNTAHFGAFYGPNGEELTSDISQSTNRYFKKLENVAELSIDQMNSVGVPKTYHVYDGNTNGHWEIYFLCWSITYEPIYTVVNGTTAIKWPSSSQLNHEYDYGYQGYRVRGYYPSKNSTFSTFYTNTLLSIYDDKAIEINGKKCLFVYPVYTIGKDYISYWTNNVDNCVDSVLFRTYDITTKEQLNEQIFVYDGSLSSSLNTSLNSSSFEVFRLDNIVFDENNFKNYKYTINVDRSLPNNTAWLGTRYMVTDTGQTNYNPVSSDEVSIFYNNAYNIAQNSGRYNIYLISKSNNSMNSTDITAIDKLMSANNVNIYFSNELDYMHPDYNSRDYYIVYERIYEPRLIGGSTGQVDYRQNTDYVFTRVSPTGAEKNHYILRNVYLNPNDKTNFDYTNNAGNEYKGTIKNNEFAIQLLPEDGMSYDQIIVSEPNNLNEEIPADWPTLVVSDQKGASNVYPYKSSSLLKNSTDKPKLAQTTDTDSAGLYNLYIKVNYSTESGRNVPSSIEIYAYQFNDMYINVYDGGESTVVYHKEDVGLTNINETGYLTSAACTLRMINLKQGSNLTADTPLTYYQEVNGQWEVVKDGDANKTKSLSTYLSEIESVGDCLKELVSGKYITSQNYTSFVIDKNYAFVRCDNPYASNQGGVTA